MKRVVTLLLLFTSILLLVGCENSKEEKNFSLEEKYYTTSSFNEIGIEEFNELVENKESFAIFIYQPLCATSYEFNQVLTEFSKMHQISFYKMSFTDMKETELGDTIKYYPSFAIYQEGKLVDYLDANSNEDTDAYKSVEGFKSWFASYVKVEEVKDYDPEEVEEIDEELKIDAKLDNVTYDENKINIYFFWGDGCPHCEHEFLFFESLETEFGDYFTLHTFEVWKNPDNEELMKQFASAMGDEVKGVPYTIIGEQTFRGFSENYESRMLEAIKTQYQNSYDVYFDETKKQK